MKKIIKAILFSVTVVVAIIFVYPYFGWIMGHYDYYFGKPKYVAYGYVTAGTSKFFQDAFKPYGIAHDGVGCVADVFDYSFYEEYNKAILMHLPPDFMKKTGEANNLRIANERQEWIRLENEEEKELTIKKN
ncbi:MAG: hypothetical protein RL404_853 [Pseudomonadota bacterium]